LFEIEHVPLNLKVKALCPRTAPPCPQNGVVKRCLPYKRLSSLSLQTEPQPIAF